MNVQQLSRILIDNGYEFSEGLYAYHDNGQATWVSLTDGHVGANMFDSEGLYEIGAYHDLTDCSTILVQALGYKEMISNPTVNQAIEIQQGAKKFVELLKQKWAS